MLTAAPAALNGGATRWPEVARPAWRLVPAFLCIVVLCFLATPFGGIEGDALIYMARAMADLDPTGVGRDLMFAQDGQAGFSVFRFFAARLVAWFGPRATAEGLAVVNMLAWCGGVAVFAGRFASGRALGFLVLCAGLLPSFYGFYPMWEAREIIATPRPLSEAGVLLALGVLGGGRKLAALLLLAAAAMLHPIMALPGVAAAGLLLGLRDRRWFALAAGLLAAALAAGWAGLPLFARLTSTIDASWLAALNARSPYLFVAQWSAAGLAPLFVQVATLLLAATFCAGFARNLLLAILAVGFAGLAVAWVFGDLLAVQLIVQAQPWRALWLVAAAAMPMSGFCALHLWKRGALGRLAAACLALAWLSFDAVPAAPLAAACALALANAARQHRLVLSRGVEPAILALLAAAATFVHAQRLYAAVMFAGHHFSWSDLLGSFTRLGILALILLPPTFLWAVRRGRENRPAAAWLALAALLTALVLTWDRRSDVALRVETNVHDPMLVALLAPHPGEVLWLGNDDEWSWLGRPQWNGIIQGAAGVFSRPLATQWRERAAFLARIGLVGPERLEGRRVPGPIIVPRLTRTAAAAICTRPDAPAWIVVPLPPGETLDGGLAGALWQAPVAETMSGLIEGKARWITFSTYAAVACAEVAPPSR